MNNSETAKRARGTRWCTVGIWLALAGVAMIIFGLAGGRLELLAPVMSFMLFAIGCVFLIASGVTTAIGIALSMGTAGDASAPRAWGALAISVIIIGATLSQRPDTSAAPPIHDITTNIDRPPEFKAILPIRADAPNPPEYAGADTARQQRSAYPDLVTLTVEKPLDDVFASAEQLARKLGWDIVAADQSAGRIEATATTAWFRFKDDVVVRLTANGSGTDIDVRSKSRVGRSDMGANAARIRTFLDKLKVEVAE